MLITEIITPDKFQFDLNDIAKDINGTQSFREIITIVEKHFPIAEVNVIRVPDLLEGELTIGAHYDPEKDDMFLGIRNDELLELIETVHTKYYWVSEIKSISIYTDIFIRLCKKHYESCNDWANC